MDTIKYIVLHHTGANNTFEGLLGFTRNKYKGKFKLTYHWFIDLQGRAHLGQPEGSPAPHASYDRGEYKINNHNALGVAVSGNYETSTMSSDVFSGVVNVLKVLTKKYNIPRQNVVRHRDYVGTLCPGRNYPYQQILDAVYRKEKMLYKDVDEKRWSFDAIEYVTKMGIMQGDEHGFRPTEPCTREELAQVIFNVLKGGKL